MALKYVLQGSFAKEPYKRDYILRRDSLAREERDIVPRMNNRVSYMNNRVS